MSINLPRPGDINGSLLLQDSIIQSLRYDEAALGYDEAATHALPTRPALMRVQSAPPGFASNFVDEDSSLSYTDKRFDDFKRIEGTHSGLIHCIERDSDEVVLVVNIVLF